VFHVCGFVWFVCGCEGVADSGAGGGGSGAAAPAAGKIAISSAVWNAVDVERGGAGAAAPAPKKAAAPPKKRGGGGGAKASKKKTKLTLPPHQVWVMRTFPLFCPL
jgi:hypothetical protein